MYAEKVIAALLSQSAPLAALVDDRIYPHELPQGCELPALVVEHVDTVPRPTLDAAAGFNLAQSRISVTAVAASYPSQKEVLHLAKAACKFQRGLIAGVQVNSVIWTLDGPDGGDEDRTVFEQLADFIVTFHEP